ncbi:MAG: ferric reductase-like transmembrane domain-containing protein [Hydrogenibacillus schlegelii]|nr:ferric reductase-like transmembrane domain-containing protein [Hydrogenibacillus schlegelii]
MDHVFVFLVDRLAAAIVALPTWEIIRASGLVAFVLLTVAVSAGLLSALPVFAGPLKAAIALAHRTAGWLALAFGLGHALFLIVDPFVAFPWFSLFLPSLASGRDVAYGLGILALYGLAAILLTSDLAARLGAARFRRLHRLAYPVYVLSLLHGLLAGTDAHAPWVSALYGASAGIVGLLFLLALSRRHGAEVRGRPPERATERKANHAGAPR